MINFWYFFHFLAFGLFRSGKGQQKGQTVIEYLLMLAFIAGLATIFGMLFSRRLLGGFFTIVGMIIGEGLSQS